MVEFPLHTKMADLTDQRTKKQIRDARRSAARIFIGDSHVCTTHIALREKLTTRSILYIEQSI